MYWRAHKRLVKQSPGPKILAGLYLWKVETVFAVDQVTSMTLTLDFKGQILKRLYSKNGRIDSYGMKGK